MPRPVGQLYLPRTVVDASPAGNAETVISTFTGISTVDADSVVLLDALANFTVGTAGTAARLRLRQSALLGTLVGDSGAVTAGIAAGAVCSFQLFAADRPGVVANMVYVLTLQVTAATGASTVSAVLIAPLVA